MKTSIKEKVLTLQHQTSRWAEDTLAFNPSSKKIHLRLQRAQEYHNWKAKDSTGRGGAAVMEILDGTLWSL